MAVSHLDLIGLARSDPEAAITRAGEIAEESESVVERLAALRAVGLAHRIKGDLDRSIEVLEPAVTEAEDFGDERSICALRLTLSGVYMFAGRTDEALDLLDLDTCHPDFLPNFAFQRATVNARIGKFGQAREELDRAEVLAAEANDTLTLAMVFKNRAQVALEEGRTADARADFARALEVFGSRDDPLGVSTTGYSLGMLASAEGDLAEALDWYNTTEAELERIEGSSFEPGRAQVLLAAGLFDEAHTEAMRLVDRLRSGGMELEAPEALLLAANASALAGDVDAARAAASEARLRFTEQARETWANRAAILEMTADEERTTVADLEQLLERLDQSRATTASIQARSLAARCAARTGDHAKAVELAAAARTGLPSLPLPLDVDLRLTDVEIRSQAGDTAGAARAASDAMRRIARHQRTLAATDVRAGLAGHGRRIADRGLGLAVESGDPRRVWQWMEHSRATALRFQPVRASEDPDLRALLSELRKVTADLYEGGEVDQTRLVRRQRRLERQVADRARATRGGAVGDALTTRATLDDYLHALEADRCLIELAEVGGSLWAVVAFDGRTRLSDLGPVSSFLTDARQLDSQLKRTLVSAYSPGAHDRLLRKVDAVATQFRTLLRPVVGSVVVAPSPGLAALPWSRMFGGLPVSVVPSAASWFSGSSEATTRSTVAAISGPGLDHGEEEIDAIVRTYPHGTTHPTPSVGVALEAIGASSIVHLACHGNVRNDQPLFTSLRLGDGDLYLYEMERLAGQPEVIVLSACETGATQQQGREMLGMASVLMSAGVGTVIASPWPIPDAAATVETMSRLHEHLAAGESGAGAVAQLDSSGYPGLIAGAFMAFGA